MGAVHNGVYTNQGCLSASEPLSLAYHRFLPPLLLQHVFFYVLTLYNFFLIYPYQDLLDTLNDTA